MGWIGLYLCIVEMGMDRLKSQDFYSPRRSLSTVYNPIQETLSSIILSVVNVVR